MTEFPADYYKAEIVSLHNSERGVQAQIKQKKDMIQFFKKKRNSLPQIKRLRFEIGGLRWFSYVNKHVIEWLESELKDAENNKG